MSKSKELDETIMDLLAIKEDINRLMYPDVIASIDSKEPQSLWARELAKLPCWDGIYKGNHKSAAQWIAYKHLNAYLSEFVRLGWDSKVKVNYRSPNKAIVKAEGMVLHKLRQLIKEVLDNTNNFDDYPHLKNHSSVIFCQMLLEGEIMVTIGGREFDTLSDFLAHNQKINSDLKNLKNPFTQTVTKEFFDAAINIANKYDQIRHTYFSTYYKARGAVCTASRSKGILLVDVENSKKQLLFKRQGRKQIHYSTKYT